MKRSGTCRPRRALIATLLAVVAIAAPWMIAGCLHWPGAPYMDSVASLPKGVTEQLQADFPRATPTSHIYRTHLENRWGRYRVVEQTFWFEDAAGRLFRGKVDEDGSLSVSEASLVDRLPEDLQARFFEGPSAMVAEGRLAGRAWRFVEASTRQPWFEFEYEAGERRGFGSISETGKNCSAYDFVAPAE